MRRLLVIFGFTIVLQAIEIISADPKCHTSEIRKCVDIGIDWLNSLPKRSIPVTETDVDKMCEELEKAFVCADQFIGSCLTPMQRELVELSLEGTKDFRSNFCSNGSPKRSEYLSHAECVNKVSQMDEVKDTVLWLIAAFEKFNDIENNKKLTYACCAYGKAYNDVYGLERKNCGEGTDEAYKEFIAMIVSQLPEVICSGFTGNEDKCKAILPPEGSKPTDGLKSTAIYDFISKALGNWID